MSDITITIRGTPKPQPRPKARVMQVRGKPVVKIYTPTTGCEEWRRAVRDAAALQFHDPLDGALELEVIVFLDRPQRLRRARDHEGPIRADGAVGDADNYAKAVLDAMTGVAFRDDSQVTDLIARKRYAAKGAAPGAVVFVRAVDAVPAMFDTP